MNFTFIFTLVNSMVWKELCYDPGSNIRCDKVPRLKHLVSLHHYFENDHCVFFLAVIVTLISWIFKVMSEGFLHDLGQNKNKASTKNFSEVQWLLS